MSNTENVPWKWLADEMTDESDIDLVSLVSSSLNYDIDKTRAFVVALLGDVNDHHAAAQVNDTLLGSE
jgi:hypothetical protein